MKKKLMALVFVFAVFAFTACGGSNVKEVVIDEQKSYVFTASPSVTELTENTSVADYLNALKERGEITFEGYGGDYGYFITSVNGIESKTVESAMNSYKGYFWYLYLDFIRLEGDSAYYGSDQTVCRYKGTTLYQASYGISSIPCVKGHTYALVYVYEEMSW